MLNIQKKTILVTDGWKGTIAAVKQFRKDKGWSTNDLIHEIVNHSKGEITNVNGFTTNHIEGKWSSMKRWLKKLNGGKLPSCKDRGVWNNILWEYTWRKNNSTESLDWNNTFIVPFATFMEALVSYIV